MIYVTIIGHGPNWVSGKSVYEQDRTVIQAHLDSMRQRFNEGTLLLGGPFDRAGGIAIWQADDRDHAHQLIDADPGVVADVMNYELYELTAYFDRFSEHSATGDIADLARAASAPSDHRRPPLLPPPAPSVTPEADRH